MKFPNQNRNFLPGNSFNFRDPGKFFFPHIFRIAEWVPLDVIPVDPAFRSRPLKRDVLGIEHGLNVRDGLRDDGLRDGQRFSR